MSNVTIKMDLTAAEYEAIVKLVVDAWTEAELSLYESRASYAEYRSAEDREAGKPERIARYSVSTAESALRKLRDLEPVAAIVAPRLTIDADRVALLTKVKAELSLQTEADEAAKSEQV